MLLLLGAYLFNVLCGFVPCDPVFQKPEVQSEPLKKFRNLDLYGKVDPIVTLPIGTISGYKGKSMHGRDIFSFEGIPYAESTAGSRRWKPPVPKAPWTGVLRAHKTGPDCTQISPAKILRVYGSEDCLFLNVYTPYLPIDLDESLKLPVVVFIHGGSFLFGSGAQYGPTYLMNEDVVLITLNYRLGVMGFLSTGDSVVPGNYGLKDQALALKWVYDNIEHFGGNQKNISLWGNSAGGVSAHLHLIANKTQNYFTTVFTSSGTAFQDWSVQNPERMRYLANRLARRFSCQNDDSRALASCLQRINVNSLVAAQLNLFDWFPFPPVLFSPTVEPDHKDAFLTIYPKVAYEKGLVPKKPFVMGVTKDEGKSAMILLILFMRTIPLRIMWEQIAPYFLNYHSFTNDSSLTTQRIQQFYLDGKRPRIGSNSIDKFADMATDRYLAFGIMTGMQAHASSNAPTYSYFFSFSDGNHNLGNVIGYKSSEWGAGHAEDIFYFFNGTDVYDGQKESDPDHELSKIMINMMVNFAATGEPLYRSENGSLIKIWDPVVNPSKIDTLQLDKEVKMISYPSVEKERLNFWDSLHLTNFSLWSTLN